MTGNISPAVQNAVQRIDKQILHHLGPAHDLKSQRNALMPISQLPPEILGRIFHEVRGNNRHDQDVDRFWTEASYSEPSLEWISVSHVSQHWRNVATNDAHLWTDPPLKNLQWTMIMLERSSVVTIPAITLKVKELDKRVVAALAPHIPRVSSLVIPNMDRGTLNQVLSGLPLTAPELEALSISSLTKKTNSVHTSYYRATFSSYEEVATFPDDVLRHTPKLQHLQLNDIIIQPDSSLLSNLTTLSMSGLPAERKPTPQQFKTMPSSAPYLKRLILWGACPSAEIDQQEEWAAPVLRMRHLEYLDINETIPQLICFFRFFSATDLLKTLTVNVDATEICPSESDLPLLFATLDQPYLRSLIGSSTDVRRLVVGTDDREPFIQASKISLSERSLEPDKRRWFDDSDKMTIWFDPDLEEVADYAQDLRELTNHLLSELFNNFTWSGLAELDIASLDCASPRVLASKFGTVSTLRIIVADSGTAHLLIQALKPRFAIRAIPVPWPSAHRPRSHNPVPRR